MHDLDQQLRTYFDALADDVVERVGANPHLRSTVAGARRSRWRRATLAAAMVLIVGVATVAIVQVVRDAPSERVAVSGSERSDSTTTVGPPGAVIAGEWRTLPTALHSQNELSPYAVALDADRVLVLFMENGGNDVVGEIIDLEVGTATPIASSPLRWRAFALVGWTGSEVVVAGGSNGPGIDVAGAAYNPASNSWRQISDPPGFVPGRSENQVGGPGVWSGTELISWQSRLAYNPATDRWRKIADPPLEPRMDETVVATPEGVIVWGGCDSVAVPNCDDARTAAFTDGAIYDAATDTWSMLPAGPLGGGVGAVSVWTPWEGGVIIVVPDPADPARDSVAAFDPVNERWRALPDLPDVAPGPATDLVWTGSHAVLWGGYTSDISSAETDRGVALDPTTQQWAELVPGGGARRGHTALWTPHGLLVVGGSPNSAAALFAPLTDELGDLQPSS